MIALCQSQVPNDLDATERGARLDGFSGDHVSGSAVDVRAGGRVDARGPAGAEWRRPVGEARVVEALERGDGVGGERRVRVPEGR